MHQTRGGTTAWRRRYQYALSSNQLVSTSDPADGVKSTYVDPAAPAGDKYSDTYTHDAHGSITAMPGLLGNLWNDMDELQEVDLGGGGNAYYAYSGGQRVRKLIRRPNGTDVVERIYLGGWELYRRHQTSSGVASNIGGLNKTEEIETLHVMDDQRRVAMVESKTVDAGAAVGSPVPRARYQLQDHLGTCTVEQTDAEEVISYEEYYPYGAVAYSARSTTSGLDLSPKRYRYTLGVFGEITLRALLRLPRSLDPAGELTRWIPLLMAMLRAPNGLERLRHIIEYLALVADLKPEALQPVVRQLGPAAEETAMTLAERLRQQGSHQGQAKVILRQLQLKFGDLPEAVVAQVEAGTEADFERWTERVLLATTIDQVFDDSPLT